MSHSQPVPGHFNDDNILDLFIQSSANGIMQVKQNPHSGQKVKQNKKKKNRIASEDASVSGAGCRRRKWASSLGGQVCVSSRPFGSDGGLHLSGPIGLPLLGQRTNQSAEEHYQGDGKSASENTNELYQWRY